MTHPLAPLHAVPQWIVVRLDPLPNGRTDKVPVNSAGVPSDAHNPTIWLDHATAAATATAWGPQYTVGFVLNGTGIWCLDVDDALQSDGTWPQSILDLCASLPGCVIEVSLSGRGLHLWGQGVVPPHRGGNVPFDPPPTSAALYSDRRFIAIGTGAVGDMTQPCPTIAAVALRYWAPRHADPSAVPDDGPRADWHGPDSDDELLRRALQSRSASATFGGSASFADLWEARAGVLARCYPSDRDAFNRSDADAALAQHLAFWTGCGQARMARLMRRSALCREKYDRDDYLPRTIAGACGRQREVLQDRRPEPAPIPLTLGDALAQVQDLNGEQCRAAWLPLALRLNRVDRDLFIDRIETLAGVGRQALKASLREARSIEARQALRARIEASANGRARVEWIKDSSTDVAREVERLIVAAAEPGEYLTFGGILSHVTSKPLPCTHLVDNPEQEAPPVPQIEPLDDVALLAHVERVVQLYEEKPQGPSVIGVPDRLIRILLGKRQHAAPTVGGLLTHPIVMPNGEILAADGLHARSGLYLHNAAISGLRAYSRAEASAALHRIRATLFEGFEFATPLDADVAMAGLLTGLQRRLLDTAPGLAVIAAMQASGKTTLVRLLHVIFTRHDMPATTFAEREEEFQKQLLSTLMRSPALVCYDNLGDGSMLRSKALAAAMTLPAIDQRVLGASTNASPPTSVLFTLTGNNIAFGPDEVSRWMVCRLAPKSTRPEERVFRHTDIRARGLQVRDEVLRDAVGIVAGYVAEGAPRAEVTGSRFAAWDRMVRQPLLWAGAVDVAQVFRHNADDNPEGRAHMGMLWALRRVFGERWFTAAEAHAAATIGTDAEARQALADAFETMAPRRPESPVAVGKLLAGKLGRSATIDGQVLRLTATGPSNGTKRFRVEA